jgi:lysyl-tRNA synthetase class II
MVADINMICRAEQPLEKGWRLVSIIDDRRESAPTYFYKLKYWNDSSCSEFMKIKVGTLIFVKGTLVSDETNGLYIECEKVQFLSTIECEMKAL